MREKWGEMGGPEARGGRESAGPRREGGAAEGPPGTPEREPPEGLGGASGPGRIQEAGDLPGDPPAGPRKLELRDVGTQASWGGGSQAGQQALMGEAAQMGPAGCRAFGVPLGGWAGWGEGPQGPLQGMGASDHCECWVMAKRDGPKDVGTQQPGGGDPEEWEMGAREMGGLGGGGGEIPRVGVSRSLSGGIPGHHELKRETARGSAMWVHKEWCEGPVETSGQVWVPRKPARTSSRLGLNWSQEGTCHPKKSGDWEPERRRVDRSPDLGQVWIPREKSAPAGGGPGDVWVHKVRDPSGTGVMWVWAQVTNCGEEEVEEARVWTYRKEGPRKGGQGEGGYGVS